MSNDQYAELEAALIPLREAFPGLTNALACQLLPEHLVPQLWERAIDRYLDEALSEDE